MTTRNRKDKATFPSDPYSGTRYQPCFQSLLATRVSNIPRQCSSRT
jgi:hypothetical protein